MLTRIIEGSGRVTFRLPPLNTLRLFEAAGRHLSFKLAAEELQITPSAVSHGVQGLEDWLGTQLFTRGRRGLSLTGAGKNYYPAVRDALALIAAASGDLPGRRPRNEIRISVTPTFGARILLPKLARFRERHPDTSVFIDTAYHPVEFPRDGADLAIRMGEGRWPGLAAEHLLAEWLIPLCTPALRERLLRSSGLCEMPLIHVTSATEDWQAWSDAAGYGRIDCSRGLRVDTIQMAIDAAVRGLGIVIGRKPLVCEELRSGALVPAIDRDVRGRVGYWLVGLPETMRRADIGAFRSWLKEELAGETVASPTALETGAQPMSTMPAAPAGSAPGDR